MGGGWPPYSPPWMRPRYANRQFYNTALKVKIFNMNVSTADQCSSFQCQMAMV